MQLIYNKSIITNDLNEYVSSKVINDDNNNSVNVGKKSIYYTF